MKFTRAFATIILSILLFPTILLGIQGLILKNTLFDASSATDLMEAYELNTIADTSLVIDLEQSLSDTINENQDQTQYDSILLASSTDLTRQSIKGTLEQLYLGMHLYLFTDVTELPLIDVGYLEPTFKSMVNTLNDRYDNVFNPDILTSFPQFLDINKYFQQQSPSEITYFERLKSITYYIPKIMGISLIVSLILGAIAYTVIHRYDWVRSISFISLIGTLASLLTLILLTSAFWFFPQNNPIINLITFPFFGLRDDYAFLAYASNAILAEGIRLCLILLIIFVVGLIASEIKHRLYPKKTWVESHNEARLQVIIFMVTIGLLMVANLLILKPIPSYYETYASRATLSISENGQEPYTFLDLLLSTH